MTKFLVVYNVAGRPGEGITIEHEQGQPPFQAVARVILAHEFAEVDAPFGIGEMIPPAQALRRFGISDVRLSVVTDDSHPSQ